ncbi:MAG TPA: hypothetical protein PLV21_01565 [Cyclobacteriaceae bacterium]|nr:hypothetical protein [Cyclobacteriaceae bacterium]HRJ80543.1 hypothetical protein [Cyclobacteriaceae bacterium]
MNRIFLPLLIFAVASATAQINKGTILLAGSSNLSGIQQDEDAGDDVQFNFSTKGGYFLMDNLALGLNLSLNKPFGTNGKTFGIGPFARYYFGGKFFLGAGFTSYSGDDYSYSEIPIELGYAIFLADIVALEPSLFYSKFGGDAEGALFGLNLGISIYFGR